MSALISRFHMLADRRRFRFVDDEGSHTGKDLVTHAQVVARALTKDRVSLEGQRVALLIEPSAAFVSALFGVWLSGGAAIVLSPLHPPKERNYFCNDARVQTLVFSPAMAGLVAEMEAVSHTLDVTCLEPRGELVACTIPSSHPALQLYTSGTTGKPKGAVLSHENLAVQQALLQSAWQVTDDDLLLHALPLHHMHGLVIALLTAMGSGASVHLLPKFDARAVWDHFATSTMWMAVPTMYAKLLTAFDEADETTRRRWEAGARSLRLCTSGSAALPVTVGERWRAIAGEYPLERFGMTEIGVGVSNPLAGERKPGTVGRPLPSVGTAIEGDDGAPSDSGELLITGPSVFSGYFERPKENDESFIVKDGVRYFRTGDTVRRAEDGYIQILGRTSVDILKSGGYKLSALEIEEVLREHPDVGDAAVVGLPDTTWGERVVACVVPRRVGDACTSEALLAFCRDHLAPYKCPRTFVFMEALPRNALGKVTKPELLRKLISSSVLDPIPL